MSVLIARVDRGGLVGRRTMRNYSAARSGNEALPTGVMAVLAKDRLELTLAPLIRQQMRPAA
ncbi:MAG TPA: hypothetical protein VNV15_05055 [Opitutaceae bacterium]|jgi:hypothetical protein|nr:hypothetical protein [Opitutaceae bacterium]